MENRDYIALLNKQLTESISQEEERALNAWLNASNENTSMAEDISLAWSVSESYNPNMSFDPSKGFSKFQQRLKEEEPRSTKVVRLLPQLMRVAAAVVFLTGAWFAYTMIIPQNYTAEGDTLFVSLEDGSEVWLSDGSTLIPSEEYNLSSREVVLEGEAFFDIQRDEEKEFVISVNDSKVRVLGTSFNIESTKDGLILEVKEGLVELTHNGKKTLAEANDKVIVRNTELIKTAVSSSNSFTWIDKELIFNDTPMTQVFEDLARYYNVEIDIAPSATLNCNFTAGNLKSVDLKDVLDVLSATFKMDYAVETNGNISVYKFECK